MIKNNSLVAFQRWAKRLIRLFGIVLFGWVILSIGLMILIHTWGLSQTPANTADAVVVLGAGVNEDGTAGVALRRRAVLGAERFLIGNADSIICAGAKPYNRQISEAQACKTVLMMLRVPETQIWIEETSRSTEENAIYVAELMRENGWSSAILVTDSFHAFRVNWLFRNRQMTYSFALVPPVEGEGVVTYVLSLARESFALQWQWFKDFFNLPFTYVPVI